MYLGFYGFKEEPFGVTPDPRFLYPTPAHREAFASLAYGIEAGRGFMALTAEAGMGKTTLLFQLLERIRGSACSALVFHTQCGPEQLLRYVLNDMGIETLGRDLVQMHYQLNQELIRIHRSGKNFVAIIDEAQNLSNEALESVRLLSDFETSRSKLMQIVLSGQPQLAEKLSDPALVQLRQRVSMICRLNPLTREEVDGYIRHRLSVAGYRGGQLFTPEARALIAEASKGIPRNINNLCFNALSLGFALSKEKIDSAAMREVLADLDLRPLTPAHQMPQKEAAIRLTAPGPGASEKSHRNHGPIWRAYGGVFAAAALLVCIISAPFIRGWDFYDWMTGSHHLLQAGSTAASSLVQKAHATNEQTGLPSKPLHSPKTTRHQYAQTEHRRAKTSARTGQQKAPETYADASKTGEARPRTESSGVPPQTPSGSGISPVRGNNAPESSEFRPAQSGPGPNEAIISDSAATKESIAEQNCRPSMAASTAYFGRQEPSHFDGFQVSTFNKSPIPEPAFMQFRDLPAQNNPKTVEPANPCPERIAQTGKLVSNTPGSANAGRQTQAKP